MVFLELMHEIRLLQTLMPRSLFLDNKLTICAEFVISIELNALLMLVNVCGFVLVAETLMEITLAHIAIHLLTAIKQSFGEK